MLVEVIVIAGMEVLAIGCFCAGFIFGRFSTKQTTKIEKIYLTPDDLNLDPITPEEQYSEQSYEKEVKKNGEEDEDYV